MSGAAESPIAAIATAPGPAGVSVVRISGDGAFAVAAKIVGRTDAPERAAVHPAAAYARFRDCATGVCVDDGIALFFKGPRSYTGEDVVELQGHGGRLPAARLLAAAVAAGARPAEPGEFTRRAFLNGKIDLARAEAVMDFVGASSERAAAAAREQLDGRLSTEVDALFDAVVAIEADVEHLLDFDEGEVPASFAADAAARCAAARGEARRLVSTWRAGTLLRDGAVVVICGRPNAGKSSLLNAILGRARAIVSPVAGTTRDTIEEQTVISGFPVRLIDTAGLRAADDAVEAEGVRRAEESINHADVVVEILDATDPSAAPQCPRGDRILAVNKTDIAAPPAGCGALPISAKTGAGVDALVGEIAARLDALAGECAGPGVSERHRACLEEAASALADAEQRLAEGDEGLVAAAAALARAAQSVGGVTGRVWSDELLDAVFGKFCIGK